MVCKQKNLVSNIFENTDQSKNDLDNIKIDQLNSQGWRNGAQKEYQDDLKKTEMTLNQANLSESTVRRQNNLRSCLESADEQTNQMKSKGNTKKVVEYELDFGIGMNEDTIFDKFKGMHIINKEIKFNNITGEVQGKGKISLRIDDTQESIVQNRIDATPNMKANKLDLDVKNERFNKKTD